ncbi:MAG: hypothetical protein KDC61_17500 [Saprospiraceae bacterium]|nr:hypothetical protein [Saprospiraceae bacterium]
MDFKILGLDNFINKISLDQEDIAMKLFHDERFKNLVLTNKLDSTSNAIRILFNGFTDSALSMVLREGLVWNPSPLRANHLLNMPVFGRTDLKLLAALDPAIRPKFAKYFDWVYEKYTRDIQFPALFNYIITQASSINDIFKIALDLKTSKELRRYKLWCSELDNCLKAGMQEDADKLMSEANQIIDQIKNPKIRESKFSMQITFPFAASFEIPLETPNFRKNHLIFLKKLYKGSSTPIALEEKAKKLFRRV